MGLVMQESTSANFAHFFVIFDLVFVLVVSHVVDDVVAFEFDAMLISM